MKILQIITDTDRRGAQVFALDLGAAMEDRGHMVSTVALAAGKQTNPLEVETLGNTQRGLTTLRALRKRMQQVDITIAHGSTTLFAAAVAGFPTNRFVYRQISDSKFWASTWRRRVRTALLLRRASRIVALSDTAKGTLVEHVWAPKRRITVIPNGVPIGDFHPPTVGERSQAREEIGLSQEAFVVCYVGALVPEKGVRLLLDAVEGIPRVEVVIAGDGPERNGLRDMADANLPGRVHFLGPVAQPFAAYAAADVSALPSLGGDSMPATLIEAGLCALPSIATPIGSIPDIVIDGETGLIVEVGCPSALADAILCLSDDLELARGMGFTAQNRCLERFEIRAIARDWIHVTVEALAQ